MTKTYILLESSHEHNTTTTKKLQQQPQQAHNFRRPNQKPTKPSLIRATQEKVNRTCQQIQDPQNPKNQQTTNKQPNNQAPRAKKNQTPITLCDKPHVAIKHDVTHISIITRLCLANRQRCTYQDTFRAIHIIIYLDTLILFNYITSIAHLP